MWRTKIKHFCEYDIVKATSFNGGISDTTDVLVDGFFLG